MQKGRKLWEKTLAIILAVVCCLSIINLAPFAKTAKAAGNVVYIYVTDDATYNGIWYWGGASGEATERGIGGLTDGWYDWYTDGYFDLEANGLSGLNNSGTQQTNGADQYFGFSSARGWSPSLGSKQAVYEWLGISGGGSGGGSTVTGNAAVTAQGTPTTTSEGFTNWRNVQSVYPEDDNLYYANAIIYDYFNETQVAAAQAGLDKWDVSKTAFDAASFAAEYGYGDKNQNGAWKTQFQTFNASLVRDYKFNSETTTAGVQGAELPYIYHPLYVGSFDGTNWWGNYTYPPMEFIYSRAHIKGYYTGDEYKYASETSDDALWEWRLNHGLDEKTTTHAQRMNISVQNIANSKLGPNGELLSNNDGTRGLNGANNLVVIPEFDQNYLETTKIGAVYGSFENPLGFPFRKDTREGREGYYIYDSTGADTVILKKDGSDYRLEYSNEPEKRTLDAYGAPGYFPFSDFGQSAKDDGVYEHIGTETNANAANFAFGTRMDIPFIIPSDAEDEVVFHFSGDDDLWVFVDGELALDLGGAHKMSTGNINFTTGVATADLAIEGAGYGDDNIGTKTKTLSESQTTVGTKHLMTIYYMERGLIESNLLIEFNFIPVPQENGLTISNTNSFENINPGFLTGIDETDFPVIYDVRDYSQNLYHLYENDTLTLPRLGSWSSTSMLEQEQDTEDGTIRGDVMRVTQNQLQGFTTSWVLRNTAGNVIQDSEHAAGGNPYNIEDGRTTFEGNTDYFTLNDPAVGTNDTVHLKAEFKNVAKGVNVVIKKTDTSVAATDDDEYEFKVFYNQILGKAQTGYFEGNYKIKDTRTNVTRDASTDNGTIKIHAYEEAVIEGVPAYSNLNIYEVHFGSYVKTVLETTGAEIDNNSYYFTITGDFYDTYTFNIYNGDENVEVYYAEAGTPIVINNQLDDANFTGYAADLNGELNFPTKTHPVGSGDALPYTWTVTVPAHEESVVTGSFTLANNGGTYQDTVVNLPEALPGGEYRIKLSASRGDGIRMASMNVNGWNATTGTTTYTWENIEIRNDGGVMDPNEAVYKFGDGTNTGWIKFHFGENVTGSGLSSFTIKAATWADYTLDYEIYKWVPEYSYNEQRTTTESDRYDYYEKITHIENVSSNADVQITDDGNSITYKYNGGPAVDEFYYVIDRMITRDISIGGVSVILGDETVIATRRVPVKVYNYQANENTYVVDYGLPVNVSDGDGGVLVNDVLSFDDDDAAAVNLGVSAVPNVNKGSESIYTAAGIPVGTTADATYGVATFASNKYEYTPVKFLNDIDTFYYAEQVVKNGAAAPYNAAKATPVMTAAVKIIPANVVYYEDNFSYYSDIETTDKAITYSEEIQTVDSTGLVRQTLDQSSLYGFDPAYVGNYGDSYNQVTELGNGTTVQFAFKGTGFDIIARTNATSAAVLYAVYDENNKAVKFGIVDTKYVNGELYQLPVISVEDLTYGQYTVKLQIMAKDEGSKFYFDGIRIYNPYNGTITVNPVAVPDKSLWTLSAEGVNAESINLLPNAIDGNEERVDGTRWSTQEAQAPGQTLIINLGAVADFDRLTLLSAAGDDPAAYTVSVSNDGSSWTQVLTGVDDGDGEGFNDNLYLDLGHQTAQYIKVEQTGSDGHWWCVHEIYVTNENIAPANVKPYIPTEQNANFQSVRQMVLGDCTMSETSFIDANGNVVTSTVIPGSTATISGSQITEDNGEGAEGTHGVSSVVESLQSAPNNEVYLGSGSTLSFKVAPVASVSEANRTLQIEAKLVKTTGEAEPQDASFTINGTPVSINSSTAMYYNITPDNEGNVVIGGVTAEGCNLSLTNIKYAGYTFVANEEASIVSEQPYITAISINGGTPVGYSDKVGIEVKANDKVNVALTFSKSVTVSSANLKLYVNGKQGVYYFNVDDENGDTTVSGSNIPVQIVAPRAAGSYTLKFEYTDEDGNTVSKTVNLNVTAKSKRS